MGKFCHLRNDMLKNTYADFISVTSAKRIARQQQNSHFNWRFPCILSSRPALESRIWVRDKEDQGGCYDYLSCRVA